MDDIVIVGAGLFGSVMAERIASVCGRPVTVLEKRAVPGGNCAAYIDPRTGIECHQYGSHIFHTSNKRVWDYIRQFCRFNDYRHRVYTISGGRVYNMPINLKTLSDIYNRTITPGEAAVMFPEKDCGPAANLEEKAIRSAGAECYRTLIYGYTRKQWNCEPRELPESIIKRLPVRMNYNSDYFSDPWQGIPADGYAQLFRNLLSRKNIRMEYNTDFESVRDTLSPETLIIYTGPIDEYFHGSCGTLEWRSLRFEWEYRDVSDFQGTSVVNYADLSVPYTRIHEFKHYHPEWNKVYAGPGTVICREYPADYEHGKNAYYPVNTQRNEFLLKQYQAKAAGQKNLCFGGRLGSFRYLNMDQTIAQALSLFDHLKERFL